MHQRGPKAKERAKVRKRKATERAKAKERAKARTRNARERRLTKEVPLTQIVTWKSVAADRPPRRGLGTLGPLDISDMTALARLGLQKCRLRMSQAHMLMHTCTLAGKK